MANTTPPRVFVSHASEDKARFVVPFAQALRARGIDAWLDKWEMLPGDSLVDKIFEEGLKEAEAVLIVLSAISVTKPWVREELNAAFVARISRGTKLIPIVLDDCEVPEALASTKWERVADCANFGESLDHVVAAIFGHSIKPPLGPAPAFTSVALRAIPGLTNTDNLVLKLSCDALMEKDGIVVDPDELFEPKSGLGLGQQDVLDSIEILERRGYFKVSRSFGGEDGSFACHYRVTPPAFDKYARTYIPDYDRAVTLIASCLVNGTSMRSSEMASTLKLPPRLVEHVLRLFEYRHLIKLSGEISEDMYVYSVSADLRRQLS